VLFEDFSILATGPRPWRLPVSLATAGFGLGLFLWAILALLAATEGVAGRFFSIEAMAIHARLLLALPIILWCEETLALAIHGCCRSLVRSKIVLNEARIQLDADAAFLSRLRDSWAVYAGLVIVVVVLNLISPREFVGSLHGDGGEPLSGTAPLATWWYWAVCLPAFRLIAVRFVFLFALWVLMIRRISRQRLDLVATHPDLAGGLGLVEDVQTKLTKIVMVISIVNAASLAAAFQTTRADLNQVYLYMFVITLLGVAIVCGPLLLLAPPLTQCRRKGMVAFSDVTFLYAHLFDEKWVRPPDVKYDEFLGTADIQSLADISSAFMNVKMMRILLINRDLVTSVALYAAVPLAPLLLFVYRIDELLPKIFGNILGLSG
jgi:hypothetical protein